MANSKDELQDFLKDEYFVQWVRHPDRKTDAYWKNWMRQHPDKIKQLKRAQEIVSSLQYQQTYNLPQATYDRMLEAITDEQVKRTDHTAIAKRKWFLRMAASLILLLLGGLAWWYLPSTETLRTEEPVSFTVKRTQKGEKRVVRLPDGTRVKLNANSMLVYPTEFDDQSRQVQLEGEALFAVAKDADRPFTIQSGEVKTQVLGTTFNVRAYEEDPNVTVAVVSGKVSVARKDQKVYLSPNQVSYYHKSDSSLSSEELDVSDLIAWSRNILIFEEDPAEVVWKKLENWYGVTIILPENPVIQGNYSGRFHNESLSRVLDGISYASEFVYEIQENNRVLIKEMPMK